jgi:hypothetical protein
MHRPKQIRRHSRPRVLLYRQSGSATEDCSCGLTSTALIAQRDTAASTRRSRSRRHQAERPRATRAFSCSLAPPGEATLMVEAAVRWLRLVNPALEQTPHPEAPQKQQSSTATRECCSRPVATVRSRDRFVVLPASRRAIGSATTGSPGAATSVPSLGPPDPSDRTSFWRKPRR